MIRSLFKATGKRSAAALLLLLLVLLLLGFLYIEAVSDSNLRRIEQFREEVGASTAAQLWAMSVDRRDSAYFPLRDRSWIEHSEIYLSFSEMEYLEDPTPLSTDLKAEFLAKVRAAKSFSPPETVDLNPSYTVILTPIMGLGRHWLITAGDASVTEKEKLENWHRGLEIIESLVGGGGLLLEEVIRISLLSSFLEYSHRWLDLDEEEDLKRIILTLSRIEPPRQAIGRVARIEIMSAIALIESELQEGTHQGFPYLFCFDLEYYLSRNLSWCLDPHDQEKLARLSEEPPFYAPVSSAMMITFEKLYNKAMGVDAQLRATMAAFELLSARRSGKSWNPPDGVEVLVDEAGRSRIHITDGPAESELYLPE